MCGQTGRSLLLLLLESMGRLVGTGGWTRNLLQLPEAAADKGGEKMASLFLCPPVPFQGLPSGRTELEGSQEVIWGM